MCEINFWLSLLIGLLGGLFVWIFNVCRDEYLLCRDKRKVFKYLESKTNKITNWRSAKRIANYTNLTIERVIFACAKNPQIVNFINDPRDLFGLDGIADPEQEPKQKDSEPNKY